MSLFSFFCRPSPELIGIFKSVDAKLAAIAADIAVIKEGNERMSAQLIELQDEVTNTVTVVGSAIVLINGIAKRIEDAIAAAANGDTLALPALSAVLKDQAAALAAAVEANTPVAPV